MAEVEDFWAEDPFADNSANGHHNDDFNDALKQGIRRAGMHWMRAGYELLAGVGALLEELAPKTPDDEPEPAEHIELE